MLSSLGRYFHTIRHLRPVQVYGRLWHRLYRPRPDLRPAPTRRAGAGPWPGPPLREPSLVGADRLRLLGDERRIAAPSDWQHAHPTALWRYNLHYFDDLNAVSDPAREVWQRALIERWLRDNPPAAGVGWDPYPTSLRLVTWIRWLLRGNPPLPGMLHSLAIQARHLRRRMEHHLLGNHLFVNAKTLIFAGTFFVGDEADGWRLEGHRILARELREQILADGGHFERSPMYQGLLLEDVLDLLALERVFPAASALAPALDDVAKRMLRWLVAMTHPDGEIAMFNDATLGVAPAPSALVRYAAVLGVAAPADVGPLTDLAASGYARVERAGAVLFTDTGELGPDYLPGHGHADTLSFELSILGHRVIVNSGVSEYGTSPERVRQRGTAAHNTVVVDGEDSSEVWSGFRVARRARVQDRRVFTSPERITIRGEHDGYHRLAGRVTHARAWQLEDASLAIVDDIRGEGLHQVEIYFHLIPGIRPEPLGGAEWSLGPRIRIETDPGLTWSVRAGTYHPAMGASVPSWVLVGATEAELPVRSQTLITWT